jgi:hypothetical protein
MPTKMGLLYFVKAILFLAIIVAFALFLEIIKTIFALTLLLPQFFFVWLINLPKIISQPRKI